MGTEKNKISDFVDEEMLDKYGVLTIYFIDEKIEDTTANYFKRRYSSEYITTIAIIENIIKNKDQFADVSDFYNFISKELEKDYTEDEMEYLKKFKDLLREYSTEYRIIDSA